MTNGFPSGFHLIRSARGHSSQISQSCRYEDGDEDEEEEDEDEVEDVEDDGMRLKR